MATPGAGTTATPKKKGKAGKKAKAPISTASAAPDNTTSSQTPELTGLPVSIDPNTDVDKKTLNDCIPNSVKSLKNKSGIAQMEKFLTDLNVDLAPFASALVNGKRGDALAQEIRRIQVNFKVLKKQALASRTKGAKLSQAEVDQFALRAAQSPSGAELQQLVDALPPPSEGKDIAVIAHVQSAPPSNSNDFWEYIKATSGGNHGAPEADLGMPEAKFWALQNYLSEKKMKADKKQWLKTGLGFDGQPLTSDDLPADDFFDADTQEDSDAGNDDADNFDLSRALAAFKEHSASNKDEHEAEDHLFKIATEKSAAYQHHKLLLKSIVRNAQEHVEDEKNTRSRFNFHPKYKYPHPPTPTELELALGDYKQEKGYLRDAQGHWVIDKQLQEVVIRMIEHVHGMLKCCNYATKSPEELAPVLDTLPATVRVKDAVLKSDVNSTDNHVRYVKPGKATTAKYAKFKRAFNECREELIEKFEAIMIWEEEFESHDDRAARFIVEEQFPAISFFNVTTECTVWNALVHY